MDWIEPNILWPIVGSIVAGALIGLDREYRGAPAGFRTHILVSLASALLMLAAVHQVRWLSDTPRDMIRIDPVRMAHGILTGIGFLGAGVIFREGFNIRGLTTAASLWITSALGTLYGVGFYGLAVLGTLATLLVLAAVSLTEHLLPQRRYLDVTVRYGRADRVTEEVFREALAANGFLPASVSQDVDGDVATFQAPCRRKRGASQEVAAEMFASDPRVLSFRIRPHA